MKPVQLIELEAAINHMILLDRFAWTREEEERLDAANALLAQVERSYRKDCNELHLR